jgi:glycosyltransferase involved in cell wall biosynthesis
VLLVANYESGVGYAWWLMENFWGLIAGEAQRAGRGCILAYPRIDSIPAAVREAPIDVVECRLSHRSWADVWRGIRLIRERRVRSIYLTDWPYLHWVYLLWRIAGVRRIVLHDHTPGDGSPARGLRGLTKAVLHRAALFSATQYVAVSEYVGRRMQFSGRVPQSRCVVVTNGIHPFACDESRRSAVRQQLGIPQDAVLIVLVSRATYYKGLDFALRCMARVLEDESLRSAVFAVHCGDGPDLPAFEELAAQLGIRANFRFLGRRQDVQAILCASDIAFHPSRGEAMSLAIFEFMCARLALLASDRPSVSSAIEPGVTGTLYRREDLEHAADSLRRLIADPALRGSLGRAAATRCQERFTLANTNRTFVEKVAAHL